ncbi:MAG: AMP-binding protein, partial [Rubrobacter sp.]|nr:AMP-binding protein [Rubrobacter sp.]
MSVQPEFSLHDLLHNSVECYPDKTAIIEGGKEYTYGELARQSIVLSDALLDAGVLKGDRVGVYMEKSWEAVVAMLACSQSGAAFVNINPLLKPAQVRYIVGDCDVRVLIGDSGKLDALEPGTVGTAFYRGYEPATGVAGSLADVAEILQREDVGWTQRPV